MKNDSNYSNGNNLCYINFIINYREGEKIVNKVVLIGRLTAKPELRFTNSNVGFTRFTLAVNRQYSGQDGKREADFINVVAWRKQAETIAKYFDKGNLIAVEGRLQTSSYSDKDGSKRYTVDVALDNFEFIESKKSEEKPKEEVDPFAEYGKQITIDDDSTIPDDDSDLPF